MVLKLIVGVSLVFVSTSASAQILPSDRITSWVPGLMASGGIPNRTTVCATLAPHGGGRDDTAQIQAAVNACPADQVVQLTAGTFIINSGNFVLLNKGITLRGTGPGRTTLAKTDGAKPDTEAVGANPSPLVIVGPSRWSPTGDASGVAGSTNLTVDAAKGANTAVVTSTAGFSPGQIVLLDEASGAGWQTDPQGRGQIWASPDFRVVWQKHNPEVQYVDDFAASEFPTTPGSAGQWFSRLDRPTAELKQVASVSGSTVTFTTPVHISYRTSHTAQLSIYGQPHVTNAGVENLTLIGGDNGNLRFSWAALSWAKNVENTVWHDEGFAIESSFKIELREFNVHDGAWSEPGGGGYAISLSEGSAEILIENGIAVRANKVIVARSSGAGSVIGYNYMDMGYINTNGAWIEVGLNASHMVGPHHVLFEGNYGFNADSDQTHGNSIYHTFLRNYLRGIRAPFNNQAGGALVNDANQSGNGPKRSAGLMAYSYWMSFVGNVLGVPGGTSGWVYETTFLNGAPGIWMLGWDAINPYPVDARVASTAIRHGNFDYVTNAVHWDPTISDHIIPNSMYLSAKPAFFGDLAWPWVDPINGTIFTLPAKARFDGGNPPPPPPSPVNGACGSANGVAVSTAPTANLCRAGSPSSVSGSGPWTWTCAGSNGGSTASCSAPVASAPPPTVTMGETAVFTDIDGQNGGLLLAQDAILSQAGTIRSCSFYVAAVGGALQLGVNDSTGPNGTAGHLLTQSAVFTPVLGWNTVAVAPVPAPVGRYWLAYKPSSDNLSFPVERDYGQFIYAGSTFGSMPATFPPPANPPGTARWSFYCTASVP